MWVWGIGMGAGVDVGVGSVIGAVGDVGCAGEVLRWGFDIGPMRILGNFTCGMWLRKYVGALVTLVLVNNCKTQA